jgi:SnoaL-like domain
MASVKDVARDFTTLLRQGQFEVARERFWADDIKSIEPHDLPDGSVAINTGIDAARTNNARGLGAPHLHDLSIDGPFVTGDQFALFLDMIIASRADGQGTPFTEIAVFTVRDGRISEERYFYE